MDPQAFYVTGGTLPGQAPSYVSRRADTELVEALQTGAFCYVLTSRQMGKSSLVVRAGAALRGHHCAVAALSLTSFGQNLSPEQWYDGMLAKLGEQLDLEDELEDWWSAHQRQGPLQRWLGALTEVALARSPGGLMLFIDEIDVVLSLPFPTDEFFAGIRELYNRRSAEPRLERLGICLLGVASPPDLISDPRLTPFNIGVRIQLADFTLDEAAPLAAGFGVAPELARELLARVLYWTGGQPYLTQRLGDSCARAGVDSPAGVDRVCQQTLLDRDSRDKDHNLAFVAKRLSGYRGDQAALLLRYAELLRHDGKLPDDKTDPLCRELKLAGVARRHRGMLYQRNRIYPLVFDQQWIDENMPDAELRRHRAAYWRGVRRTALAAALLIATLAGLGYLWYDLYRKEHVAWFNTVAKRWGVMEGVSELSAPQRQHRAISFRVVRQGRQGFNGRVLQVESVDSAGRCDPKHGIGIHTRELNQYDPLRECRWSYLYDTHGRVVYETAFNRQGNLVWGLVYSPTAPGGDWLQRRRAHYVGADGYPQARKDYAVEYVEFDYDTNGLERRIHFQDRQGRPLPGRDGAYTQYNEYDARGLNTRMVSLDPDGQPMLDRAGNAEWRTDYDAHGNIVSGCAHDTEGARIQVQMGLHCLHSRFDQWGNHIEGRYVGIDGEPVLIDAGYQRLSQVIDARGRVVAESYFGTAGEPALTRDGYHRLILQLDEHGNQLEQTAFGLSGEAVPGTQGHHRLSQRFDPRGNIVEQAVFGVDGEPVLGVDGYHRLKRQVDPRGNEVEVAYFGLANEPILVEGGYHRADHAYDERGLQVETAYFDIDGEAVLLTNGYHRLTEAFDNRGNPVASAYFGLSGEPVLTDGDYHRRSQSFDARGNEVEEAYFGVRGEPILAKGGYHRIVDSFDRWGNTTGRAFYGLSGEPVLHRDGYHRYTQGFDRHGNLVEDAFFGLSGEPIVLSAGHHRRSNRFDGRGNIVERRYFGRAGEPVLIDNGYHRLTQGFDPRGNEVDEAYFGLADEPVVLAAGHHRIRDRFDERDRLLERRFFGLSGEPVVIDRGYHRFTREVDARGNPLEERYFDPTGKPILAAAGYHRLSQRFDPRGKLVEQSYYDSADAPALAGSGYHRLTQGFDPRGNETDEAYFGLAAEPILIDDGYHRIGDRFDMRGKLIERRFFGVAGEPVQIGQGYHRLTQRFDPRGNLIEEAFFGLSAEPVLSTNGYHRLVQAFDPRGNETDEAYFGTSGEPILLAGRYHHIRDRFDQHRRLVERQFLGLRREPVANAQGIHRQTWRYDDDGTVTETGMTGLPGIALFGEYPAQVRRIVQRLDANTDIIAESYFDQAGQATENANGFQRIENAYREPGQVERIRSFRDAESELPDQIASWLLGADQQPVGIHVEQFASSARFGRYATVYRLDTEGNVIARRMVDHSGQPLRAGARVVELVADGQAARLELDIRPGDIIRHYAGSDYPQVQAFVDRKTAERDDAPWQTLSLKRDGQPVAIDVPPGLLGIQIEPYPVDYGNEDP